MRGWDNGKLMSTIRGRIQFLSSVKIVAGPSAEGCGEVRRGRRRPIQLENQCQPQG